MQQNFFKRINNSNGYSLVEMVVAIAIVVVVISIITSTFVGFSNQQSLEKDIDVVQSYVEKARQQTLSSKNTSQFGVHFATTSVTLFQGTVYASSPSTTVYNLSSKVMMASSSIASLANDIYFQKISGEPNATATITFNLVGSNNTKSVIIYATGLSEIQ